MPLKVFVVFHETLDPGCYSALDPDEFDTITFVAVRPDVPKTYDATRFTRVVNEWELPIYDPTLQDVGYCENSAMWHAHKNGLYEPGDAVLFLQWDMVLDRGCIRDAAANVALAPLYCIRTTFDKFGLYFPEGKPWNLLLEACNSSQTTFRQPFDSDAVFPLNNAFVVPGRDLSAVLEWSFSMRETVERACKDQSIYTHLEPHTWKRIGVVYEHLHALALGCMYPKEVWRGLPGVWHPTSHSAAVTPKRVLDAVGTDFGRGFK